MSDDWLNHPNLPFFFSVRSARVTPSCVMHASPCIQTQWHSGGTCGGENGLLSKWVRADRHHRTTTVFRMSISSNDKSGGSHGGLHTLRRAQEQPHGKLRLQVDWSLANTWQCNLKHVNAESSASKKKKKKIDWEHQAELCMTEM